MEIKQNYYVYGRKLPEKDKVIIYHKIEGSEHVRLASLEGIFLSLKPIVEKWENISPGWKCIIGREDMGWAEKEYQGKFIPFQKQN